MMDLAGLEPATTCVASEVPGLFTTGGKGLAGKRRQGLSPKGLSYGAGLTTCPVRLEHTTSAPCGAVLLPMQSLPSPPPKWLPLRGTGEIRDAAPSFRILRHVLYQLSYRNALPRPGRTRTCDTVVPSEVTDLFTTGAAKGLPGNGREWDGRARRRVSSTRSSRRGAPRENASTIRNTRPVQLQKWSSLERSIHPLHHRQICIRGTGATAFFTEQSAASPPEIL